MAIVKCISMTFRQRYDNIIPCLLKYTGAKYYTRVILFLGKGVRKNVKESLDHDRCLGTMVCWLYLSFNYDRRLNTLICWLYLSIDRDRGLGTLVY